MIWKGGTAIAIAALAAVAVACGGSSSSRTVESSPSPSPSPTPVKQAVIAQVDPCTLVTAAEATTAAKTNMTNAASGGFSIPGACVYTSGDNATTVFIFAQFYPDSSSVNNISPDQIAAVMRGQYGITDAKTVTGIGDKAFEYTATAASSGQSGIALIAFKSNVIVMVVLSPSTDSNAIETLAKTAVSRLKAS